MLFIVGLAAQLCLQGPGSFHSFTLSTSTCSPFSFILVTSCSKTAAVTPCIASSHNPGEETAGEKRKVPENTPWPELDYMAILGLQGKLGEQRKMLARE